MNQKAKAVAVAREIDSLKALVRLIGLMLLFLAAIGAFVFDVAKPDLANRFKMQVLDIVSPVLTVVSSPMQAIQDAGKSVQQFFYTHAENARLREENERLLQWQAVASRLQAENHVLREITTSTAPAGRHYITARVIGQTFGPEVQSLLLNGGSKIGLQAGQAVTTVDGLVGRISGVTAHTAQVMPIISNASRVPVIMEHSRERAILSGNEGALPQLLYLPLDSRAGTGEPAVTTGEGSIFPEGIPVGVLQGGGVGAPRLQPYVDWTRLDYVQVVQVTYGP